MSKSRTSAFIKSIKVYFKIKRSFPINSFFPPAPQPKVREKSLPVPMGTIPMSALSNLQSYFIISSITNMILPSPPQAITKILSVFLSFFNYLHPYCRLSVSFKLKNFTFTTNSVFKRVYSL